MRKTILKLSSLLLLLAQTAEAQWSQIAYMVNATNDTAKDSHQFYASGADVYCTTDRGLFKTSDNGNSWKDLTYTAANTAGHEIFSVLVASDGSLFAGSDRRMFKSTDGGASWVWLNILPDKYTYHGVHEHGKHILVSCTNSSTSYIFYSADFGSTWTSSTGISGKVRKFFSDGTDLYVAAYYGIFKSTDDGKTWGPSSTGIPLSGTGITSVMRSGTKLFANCVMGTGLYESSDNAATWTSTAASVFNGFCQVYSMTQNGAVILVSNDGDCNTGRLSSLRMSTDGGATWSAVVGGIANPNYMPNLGRNTSGTSFFTKKGNETEVYRYDVPTSIPKSTVQNLIHIYPNPAKNVLTITGDMSMVNAEVRISDILGRPVYSSKIKTAAPFIADLQGIHSGLYMITVTGAQMFYSDRLVIE